MKRINLCLFLLLAGLFLFSQSAEAYMVNDIPPTYVAVQRNDGVWVDRIGNENFETHGIDYNQTDFNLNFSIYTNYPWSYTVSSSGNTWKTFAGDFGLDVGQDGFFEYALALVPPSEGHHLNAGKLYSVTSWLTPDYYKTPGSWSYGLANVTAGISGNTEVGTEYAKWFTVGTDVLPGPLYRIDLTLDVRHFLPIGFNGDIDFYWSTSTCANDAISGTVHVSSNAPEPSTWFLLGGGLVGLLAFRVKKKHPLNIKR